MKTKKFELEKEFAKRWIAALRSGKYLQGQSYLENSFGHYCCLGVACRMDHPRVDLKDKYFIESSSYFGKRSVTKNLENSMPTLLRGTDTQNAFVKKVSEMNDDDDASFLDIANWIEQNVKFV